MALFRTFFDFGRIFKHNKSYPPKTPRGHNYRRHPLVLPVAWQRKKFVDELFRTGSVSHALRVMSPVPYSQLALCTKLGNTPYRLDFSSNVLKGHENELGEE